MNIARTHGYSTKGTRCYGTHNWGAKGRINIIRALIGKALFGIGLFKCNINSIVFGRWVEDYLLPNLNVKTIIIMDNATFHKNKSVLKMIKDKCHIVEFLPPYSPDLNPIENKWSEKKAYIRKY